MARATDRRGRIASFNLFGVTIDVHVSWAIVALLIAVSLATGSFPVVYPGVPAAAHWVMAILVVLGLAASIVMHELAHTLVGRALGMPIHHITLFMFGGVAELEQEPKAARTELAMAIAGPLFSVALGLACGAVATLLPTTGMGAAAADALAYLGMVNLILAAFNMVPAFPMDGGRVLRALVWMVSKRLDRATRIATALGEAFGILLIGLGVLSALTGQIMSGLWWILIGFFINSAARSYRAQTESQKTLAGVRVAEVMTADLDTASADMTLDDFVARRLFATRHGLYPVVDGDRWIGVVAAEDILAVNRDKWPATRLADVCTPLSAVAVVAASDDAAVALERMQQTGSARVMVADHGALAGIVTLRDIQARLQLARQFAPAR